MSHNTWDMSRNRHVYRNISIKYHDMNSHDVSFFELQVNLYLTTFVRNNSTETECQTAPRCQVRTLVPYLLNGVLFVASCLYIILFLSLNKKKYYLSFYFCNQLLSEIKKSNEYIIAIIIIHFESDTNCKLRREVESMSKSASGGGEREERKFEGVWAGRHCKHFEYEAQPPCPVFWVLDPVLVPSHSFVAVFEMRRTERCGATHDHTVRSSWFIWLYRQVVWF